MPDDAKPVDLGIDTTAAEERDLIYLSDACKLVRGRSGGRVNRQVMNRYANPKHGRVFTVNGVRLRLVLPTTYRGSMRLTTAAWLEVWKRKFAELAEAERNDSKS